MAKLLTGQNNNRFLKVGDFDIAPNITKYPFEYPEGYPIPYDKLYRINPYQFGALQCLADNHGYMKNDQLYSNVNVNKLLTDEEVWVVPKTGGYQDVVSWSTLIDNFRNRYPAADEHIIVTIHGIATGASSRLVDMVQYPPESYTADDVDFSVEVKIKNINPISHVTIKDGVTKSFYVTVFSPGYRKLQIYNYSNDPSKGQNITLDMNDLNNGWTYRQFHLEGSNSNATYKDITLMDLWDHPYYG